MSHKQITVKHMPYEIVPCSRGLSLYKVRDGVRGRIPELTAPTIEDLQRYLAADHRCSIDKIKDIFDD